MTRRSVSLRTSLDTFLTVSRERVGEPPLVVQAHSVAARWSSPARQPKDCLGDWGWTFTVSGRGAAQQVCASDSFDSSGSTLRYAATYNERGIVCASPREGMRCLNADGHGFELSRERQRTF
jgi:hypothetical protein